MIHSFNVDLSDREIEVLKLLAEGKTVDDISHLVNKTKAAIYMRVDRIKDKLGAGTMTGAVCLALKYGIIK